SRNRSLSGKLNTKSIGFVYGMEGRNRLDYLIPTLPDVSFDGESHRRISWAFWVFGTHNLVQTRFEQVSKMSPSASHSDKIPADLALETAFFRIIENPQCCIGDFTRLAHDMDRRAIVELPHNPLQPR